MIKRAFQITLCMLILGTVWTSTKYSIAAPTTALTLPPGENNPRNSEGDFIHLADGRLMFVYTRFTDGAADHSAASLVARFSDDDGKTWTAADTEIVTNEGGFNVMSVSLLRLQNGQIALFYARKNSHTDCRPIMRTSDNEGKSWSEPVECITDQIGYYVLNNDRVIQMRNGRLLLPLALHRKLEDEKADWKGHILCYYSDNDGQTWQRSETTMKASDEDGKRLVAQEPGIVELNDSSLRMFIRSDAGNQLRSESHDGGVTWSAMQPSNIISPVSPASIERIPQTGDLLLVWNNHHSVDDAHRGKRTPLTVAISKDDGETWEKVKTLADDPNGWYCYTAIEFSGDHVLLGHCAGDHQQGGGLNTSKITRFSLGWLYK